MCPIIKTMEILIDYIEKHNLLRTKWVGTLNMEDYEASILHFNALTEKYQIKHIIHDISELQYNVKDHNSDTKTILEVANIRSMIPNPNYSVVFLTQKPKDIVYTYLYAQKIKLQGNYQHCSTVEKALELLFINDPSLVLMMRKTQISDNIKDMI